MLGWSLTLLLILTSCTSIRPIVKIGLIAPFEGLYRESGYAALEGMRQAVTDCTPPGMDVLPLALDDSGDPAQAQRAAQKLLVDPAVRAVVGPFLLDTVPAVTQVITGAMTSDPLIWYVPILIDPATGYADPTANTWLAAQIDYIAETTTATRVLLLGLPPAWDTPAVTSIPTLRVDDLDHALATVNTGDTILWLGRPDVGARWHTAIRQVNSTVDFWMAEQAGQEIFAAHTQDQRATHWLHWTRSSYNQWSQPAGSTTQESATQDSAIQPTDAMRDLAYHASCAALSSIREHSPVVAGWELRGVPYAPTTQ